MPAEAFTRAVTRDPLIVYTSSIFAILGLRALYLVMAGLVSWLRPPGPNEKNTARTR